MIFNVATYMQGSVQLDYLENISIVKVYNLYKLCNKQSKELNKK